MMDQDILEALSLNYCLCDDKIAINIDLLHRYQNLKVYHAKYQPELHCYGLNFSSSAYRKVELDVKLPWNQENRMEQCNQNSKLHHPSLFLSNYTTSNSYPNSFEIPKPKVRFDCSYPGCGKPFRSQEARDKHQKYHYKLRTHMCHICDKSYTQNGNLIKHMKTHSVPDVEQRRTHQCQYCDRKYTEKYNLKVHQKKFHPVEFVQLYGSQPN